MRYEFEAELWRWPSGNWVFLSLPAELSEGLRTLRGRSRAFGSMRVEATIGGTSWRTSLFPDSRSGAFLLPVKAQVRRREDVGPGERVQVAVEALI